MSQSETRPGQPLKIVAILALLAFTALIYYPGLSGSFIFDDTSNIVENPAVHMESPSVEALVEAATAYGDRLPYRPFATISLALDHWMWNGDPFGFKLTNLALHLLTTVSVLILALYLFRLGGPLRDSRTSFWAAFAVAAIWAVHPLQVSTVLYVVQRMEMLAALFTVLSLLAYIGARLRIQSGARGGGWFVALSGICVCLAVLSKETGALAPFFMLALEVLVFRFAAADARQSRALKMGFGAIVVAAFALYAFWMVPEFVFGDRFINREFTWYERLLTQLRVLPVYIGWILFPATDQYLFYYDHFEHSQGLLRPITTLLGGLFLLVLTIALWALRNRASLIALAIAWFFVAHALTSNLVSLELVFEHRNYFAVFAILLAIAAGFLRLSQFGDRRKSAWAICIVLMLGLGALTAIRSATWGDPMNLAMHHVEVNPDSERAGLDLAELYVGDDGWDPSGSPFVSSAIKQLERVARLPGSRTTADQALIILAAQRGEATPQGTWQRLLEKARNRSLNAADYDALYNLVQQRYEGLAIDDRRLWQLHGTLCRRDDIPPEIHARFGYYADRVLDNPVAASSAFGRARQLLSDRTPEQGLFDQAIADAGIVILDDVAPCHAVVDGERAGAED